MKKRRHTARRVLSLFLLALSLLPLALSFALEPYRRDAEVTLPELYLKPSPTSLRVYDPTHRADAAGETQDAGRTAGCTGQTLFVPYDDFPPALTAAFIAIEDKRFFSHNGVDLIRTARAGWTYLTTDGRSPGGSTITQQLIKNLTGHDEYTPSRKLSEIFSALALERTYGKEQILETYLNVINLGEGCFGVGAAAERYFGKPVKELTLAECASLAAITNNPSFYDPLTHPEENARRRRLILSEMCRQGYIMEREAEDAAKEDLKLITAPAEQRVSGWYEEMVTADVLRDLQTKLGYTPSAAASLLASGGLTVCTSMDQSLQSILDGYYADPSNFPMGQKNMPQSAMIVMDPRTGDVLAVAGAIGEKTADRVLNYATDTSRPSGSALKPLSVFAPAIARGVCTWGSVFEDAPVSQLTPSGQRVPLGRDSPGAVLWPRNADGIYRGRVILPDAVAHSLNTVAVTLYDELGAETSLRFLREDLGLTGLIPPSSSGPGDATAASLALGQELQGLTLRSLTGAYTMMYDGVLHPPISYRRVLDAEGRVLLENSVAGREILNEEDAALLRLLLSEVTSSGTARTLTLTENTGTETAGKTGTTQNNCDRWFIGMTPRLLAGVWVGYDYPRPLDGIPGNPALRIWDDVMTRCEAAYRGAPEKKCFDLPPGLIRVSVCRRSGCLPTETCRASHPSGISDGWFIRGTEPTEVCPLHGSAPGEQTAEPPETTRDGSVIEPHGPAYTPADKEREGSGHGEENETR